MQEGIATDKSLMEMETLLALLAGSLCLPLWPRIIASQSPQSLRETPRGPYHPDATPRPPSVRRYYRFGKEGSDSDLKLQRLSSTSLIRCHSLGARVEIELHRSTPAARCRRHRIRSIGDAIGRSSLYVQVAEERDNPLHVVRFQLMLLAKFFANLFRIACTK